MKPVQFKNRNQLIVMAYDNAQKPYGFIYPHKTVYVDDGGTLRCLKCLTEVNRQWNRAGTAGDLYCNKCEADLGRFTALGFAMGY